MFKGYWNPERRIRRMTKEQGTLPSMSNSATLRAGGAKEGIFVGAALLVAVMAFARFIARL